jgi:hypothetical protein
MYFKCPSESKSVKLFFTSLPHLYPVCSVFLTRMGPFFEDSALFADPDITGMP